MDSWNNEKIYNVEEQLNRTYETILKKMEKYYETMKQNPYDESARETLLSFGDVMIDFLKSQISIYYNLCPDKSLAEAKINRLEELIMVFNEQLERDSKRPGMGR